MLDSLSSYGQDVGSGAITLIATGNFLAGDQMVLWNAPQTTTFIDSGHVSCPVASSFFATANYGTLVVRRNSTSQSYALPFEATPVNAVTSNFTMGIAATATPTYAAGGPGVMPAKGASVTQATTGLAWTRRTSVADTQPAAAGVQNLRNIYSKWPSINATDANLFADDQSSTNSYLYRLSDNACLGRVTGTTAASNSIGEASEPRWSTRGDEPGFAYYLGGGGTGGTTLCKKDIVNGGAEIVLVNFATALGLIAGDYLYCDSEGTPSIDMRFWAFILRNAAGNAKAFIVYDAFTNTIEKAKPVATAGYRVLNSGSFVVNTNEFGDRPNWVSMSPRGDRVQIAWGKWDVSGITYAVYPDAGYASRLGTPANFVTTYKSSDWSDPLPCANDATHGAWSWGPNMEPAWTCQHNSIDTMEVCLNVANPINNFATVPGGAAAVQVLSVSAATQASYTNVWDVTLTAAVPAVVAVGDSLYCYDNSSGGPMSPAIADQSATPAITNGPSVFQVLSKAGSVIRVAGSPTGEGRKPFPKQAGTVGTGAVTVCPYSWTQPNAATNGRRKFVDLSGSWNNSYADEPGQHHMWQMSGRKRGFSILGTDGTFNANAHGYNSIFVIHHTDGRIWRAGSLPHQYQGGLTDVQDPGGVIKYFSENQTSINPFGTRLMASLNWQSSNAAPATRNDVCTGDLPYNWETSSVWA